MPIGARIQSPAPPRAGASVGVRSPGHGAAGCDRVGTVVEVAGELVRVRWTDGRVTAIATAAIELLEPRDAAPQSSRSPQ